ncbi:MAG TPA: hypothetical protein VH186_11870 [Chloroflexia bacterium]|nr:hypothetical protein [Chloroflexia bacterium]
MQTITGVLKAVFNFFVGDWIILSGVALTLLVVAVIESGNAGSGITGAGGYLFVIGVALTLLVTLFRETSA